MTKVVGRRHKVKFYFVIIITFLLLFFMGTLLLTNLLSSETLSARGSVFGWILVMLSYFMAFYTVITYFKQNPVITVDKNLIRFGDKEAYDLTSIKELHLTGKVPFWYLFKCPMEGATIYFKNGKIKYFIDDMYANSWLLKLFLEQVVIKKQDFQIPRLSNINLQALKKFKQAEVYQGNQFASLTGLLGWGIFAMLTGLIFIIVLDDKPLSTEAWVLLLISISMAIAMLLLFSCQMFYFSIVDKYFVVRNHNLVWKERIFNLDDIREVVFEQPLRKPVCLRIITKDFKTRLYPAGTLRIKTWGELKNMLETKGIQIRNECL